MNDTGRSDNKAMNSDSGVRKLSLRLKLTIIFVGIAALAVAITAFATFQKSQQALETEAFRKLTAIREMKANQIEDFFHHIEGQIRLLSEDDSVTSAILKFQKGAEDLAKAMSDEKILRERFRTEGVQVSTALEPDEQRCRSLFTNHPSCIVLAGSVHN
jgi:uncharacterized membrane protein YvbJ